jgi:hypothetical protein
MSVIRPDRLRYAVLLLLLGALAAAPARKASAAQEFRFRQTFTLSEAGLQDFDAFGAYWFFDRGQFSVDVDGSIDDDGSCSVAVTGFGGGSGLNYKTGMGASLSVLFMDFVECQVDSSSGTIEVGVPFTVGLGGGSIPAHMTLSISSSGVSIAGVTIGSDGTD